MTVAERWARVEAELARLLRFAQDVEFATRIHRDTLKAIHPPPLTPQQWQSVLEGSANIRLGVAQILERLKAIHDELQEDTDG